MELITNEIKDNDLYIQAHGRIDSANAAECEAKIMAAVEENKGKNVIFDVEDLQYISSAGLRVVLRLRKDFPNLKIINASSEVYDIFEMTGFTEMMTIEKAYRRLSVEGCEVIGRGSNGEVYRLDADTIIKVYLNPDSLPDIQRERELARRAFVLGIPTAIPYDVVRVGNGSGSVFELLNAKSFAKLLNDPATDADEIIRMDVDLLKKIHSTTVKPDDMPDMKVVAVKWAEFLEPYLPKEKWEKLCSLVKAVPDSLQMMHGDYHVKNVMLQNGEVLLIDMDTLSHGDPIFEFASIYNAYIGFAAESIEASEKFIGIPHEMSKKIWKDTLRLYFNTEDEEYLRAIEDKAALVGYMRLLRRHIRRVGTDTAEGKRVYDVYRGLLLDLIDKVDTLELKK